MHEEPRAWALHPDAFGRTSEIEWTELESAADVMPLAVLGHDVGDTRLIGGRPPQAVWPRS